jgi:hypothetical protein
MSKYAVYFNANGTAVLRCRESGLEALYSADGTPAHRNVLRLSQHAVAQAMLHAATGVKR